MSGLTAGRVPDDRCLHAVTSTSPPYALCGAGVIVARVGVEFPVESPDACPECASLFDEGAQDAG